MNVISDGCLTTMDNEVVKVVEAYQFDIQCAVSDLRRTFLVDLSG